MKDAFKLHFGKCSLSIFEAYSKTLDISASAASLSTILFKSACNTNLSEILFNLCLTVTCYRPVKVIRLLARDTVEEIMYSRAVSKLHLTNTVIEEGRFSLLDQAQSGAAGLQVCEPLYKTHPFLFVFSTSPQRSYFISHTAQ